VSVQNRCMVCTKCTIGSGIILDHPMVLLGEEAQVEAHLVCLEIVLILMQAR
jgi:serine acetyltransferase